MKSVIDEGRSLSDIHRAYLIKVTFFISFPQFFPRFLNVKFGDLRVVNEPLGSALGGSMSYMSSVTASAEVLIISRLLACNCNTRPQAC